MFRDIDNIRQEIVSNMFELEHGDKIKQYFGRRIKQNEKIPRDQAEEAIRYFLEELREDIDNKLTDYLYDEARVLKDVIERVDQYTDDED